MKKILIISFSDLRFDARVNRQLRWLGPIGNLTVVSFGPGSTQENIQYIPIRQIPLSVFRKSLLAICLIFRLYKLAYRVQHGYINQLKTLRKASFDWVIANDIESLPLAFRLQNKSKVFFDAHEYAPRHFEEKLWWKTLFAPWYRHLCRSLIPKVSAMTTVSPGLVQEYTDQFNARPVLITNATRFYDLVPSETKSPIRLVHHGIVNKSRKIENMIAVAEELGEGYVLDLILMLPEYASESTVQYFEALKDKVKNIENVSILAPLPNDQIVPFINTYDIGLFLLEPINFNYTFALPNKLFDFVQARLAIAIGPSIEMATYVNQLKLGAVSQNFEPQALAEAIRSLTSSSINEIKQNVHEQAYALSEEQNREKFTALIIDN